MIGCGFGNLDESSQIVVDKKQIQELEKTVAEQKKEIEFLRENIAKLKDWAELDIDEDGVPIV